MNPPRAGGNIGEYLVVRMADELDVRREPESGNIPPRGGEVAHVVIEHGDGGRRVLDKQCELRLALGKPRLRSLASRDVADDLRAADDAAFGLSHGGAGDRRIDGSSTFGDDPPLICLDP